MNSTKIVLLCSIVIFCLLSYSLYRINPAYEAHCDLDSSGYVAIGNYFATDNQLMDPQRGSIIPVQTLGYPFFLGSIYKLFGFHHTWVIIAQILLSLLALLLLYRIAYMLFDEHVAQVTVLLGSFNLGFLIYSQFMLTEVLLAFFLIASLERLCTYFKTSSLSSLALAGLLYGCSVAVKPVALFYIFIVIFFVGLHAYLQRQKVLNAILLCLFCFYIPVAGYMLHNKYQFGSMTIAPLMHENIYFYFLAKVIAHDQGISWAEGLVQVGTLMDGKHHNDHTRWNKPKALMHSYFYEKPVLVVRIWLHNMIKTVGALYTNQLKFLVNPSLKGTETSFFSKSGSLYNRFYHYVVDGTSSRLIHIIAFLQLLWMVLQLFFIMIGLYALWHKKYYFIVSFVIISIFYFSFITGHDGCARYRMMFEYFFILFSAFGMVVAYRCAKKENTIITYQLIH
ncbi:MAG: glycosyltransferase family 39 protein [Candidatus Babeliales bacterium]